eukprot:g81695.t1
MDYLQEQSRAPFTLDALRQSPLAFEALLRAMRHGYDFGPGLDMQDRKTKNWMTNKLYRRSFLCKEAVTWLLRYFYCGAVHIKTTAKVPKTGVGSGNSLIVSHFRPPQRK